MKFSKGVVLLIVWLNIIFTVAVLWLIMLDKPEPTALIAAWFGFTTGELWLTATIKKAKVREGAKHANQLETKAVEPEVLDSDRNPGD